MNPASSYSFRPRVFPVAGAPAPAGLLGRFAGRRPVLLDSAAPGPAEFSLLAFDPVLELDARDVPASGAQDFPAALRAFAGRLRAAGGDRLPPAVARAFRGGFLGALAYDLGVAGEVLELPAEPWGQPLVVGGLYTDFVLRDELEGETWLVLGEQPGDGRAPVAERRAAFDALLAAPETGADARPTGALVRDVPAAEHRARIEAVRSEIERGEIYQANLAHAFRCAVDGAPTALYTRLRAANPAPYMGYLEWEGGALLSSSPELLLEVERDRDGEPLRARTRPIKGTIARDADLVRDAAARAELLASAKDRAELAMIVDLERNDLGRVARPGSVRVNGYPTLQSFARVHHLVADVEAELRPGLDAWDALAALFPGGSITGAPKLRSMEVIAELEREGRGFFCGSLGLVDTGGRALWNILIRTLLWRPGEVVFRVGGGITWSSDAAAEDEETLAKARGLAAALGLEADLSNTAPELRR